MWRQKINSKYMCSKRMRRIQQCQRQRADLAGKAFKASRVVTHSQNIGIHSSFSHAAAIWKNELWQWAVIQITYKIFVIGDYSYQGLVGLTKRGAREASIGRKMMLTYVIPFSVIWTFLIKCKILEEWFCWLNRNGVYVKFRALC